MTKVSTCIRLIVLTSVWQTLTSGCMDSIWGKRCENECPVDCVKCTKGSVNSGRPCTSCGPGKYSGRDRDFNSMPYYDDCRHNCRSQCLSCTSYDHCTECVEGHYGTNCNRVCERYCVACQSERNCTKCVDGRYGILSECRYSCYIGCEGGLCDRMDGTCTCKKGYASHFCKGQPSCTNNPCACCKNNNCEKNNGSYCPEGCIDGIWGDTCSNKCPTNCVTCTQSNELPCTSCVLGKYNGRNQLSKTTYNCQHDCLNTCASCVSYDNCTECVNGRYGTECQYDCYSGCEGSGVCDKRTGKCTCKTGYASRFCKGQPPCINNPCACCKNNKCETNNDNVCTDGCINGVRGDKCDNECPVNCLTCTLGKSDNGRTCSSCELGKYSGRHRDYKNVWYFDDCRHDCRNRCVLCTSYNNCTECVNGRYGQKCEYSCYSGCEGDKCDKIDGKCTCKLGHTNAFCKNHLINSCRDFGDKCCINNERCLTCSSSSACIKCKAGYDINTNCSECVLNKYGPNCGSECDSSCKNNGEQSKCFGHNGTCVVGCDEGFYGDKCDLRCHKHCKQFICSRFNGICSHGCQDWFIISESDCVLDLTYIGGIGAAVVIAVIVVVVIVLLIKRRNNRRQCCIGTTNNFTQGLENTGQAYIIGMDNANDTTDIADNTEYHELKETVCNDSGTRIPKVTIYTDGSDEYQTRDRTVRNVPDVMEDEEEGTNDGYEVPMQHNYETIKDTYEPMNNQQNETGNYEELVVPVYEDSD